MNLQKEIKTSQLLTGLGICIILGVVLAYFLAPHLRKTIVIDETLQLGKNQGSPNTINSPPQDIQQTVDQPATDKVLCAQVITPAKNTFTGELRDFPTPCDIPEGWEPVN